MICIIGYLNTRVLNILRTSEIEYLDLAPSIGDENGLNLDSNDLFHGIHSIFDQLYALLLTRDSLLENEQFPIPR